MHIHEPIIGVILMALFLGPLISLVGKKLNLQPSEGSNRHKA